MDWLSEIEDKNKKLGELTSSDGMGEITRMARVLRELASRVDVWIEYKREWDALSDDAKELCVAANEGFREE